MWLPALLLVAGLVGWGAQAHADAPEDTADAAEAPGKPAKDKPTIANPGQNKQTTAKRNKAARRPITSRREPGTSVAPSRRLRRKTSSLLTSSPA
jgi:hypothetical protein